MDDLRTFENEYFGKIRTLKSSKDETYFIGKDISNILGYRNGSRDIERHVDEEDRIITLVFDGSQYRNTLCINESGLYSLILSSKLPKAKAFKHWVTSEILPSIRKTGNYGQFDIEKVISITISETVKQLMPLLKQNVISSYEDDGTVEEIVVKKRTRRKPAGIIEKLDPETRKIVDDMICSPRCTYKDIMEMLNEYGIEITQASISRYAQRYF